MLDTSLIAIDDSDASRRAVKYVSKFVGRRKGFRICLVHVLRPLPPALLEHGGSEDPSKKLVCNTSLRPSRLAGLQPLRRRLKRI